MPEVLITALHVSSASWVAVRPDGGVDAGQETFASPEARLAAVEAWIDKYESWDYKIHTKGFGRQFVAVTRRS